MNTEIIEAKTDQCTIPSVRCSYSVFDIRDMMTEIQNEAVTGLRNEQRWDMQKRLGKIRDKWKLDV